MATLGEMVIVQAVFDLINEKQKARVIEKMRWDAVEMLSVICLDGREYVVRADPVIERYDGGTRVSELILRLWVTLRNWKEAAVGEVVCVENWPPGRLEVAVITEQREQWLFRRVRGGWERTR